MKKNIAIILILIIVAITAFLTWYIQTINDKKDVTDYNSEYETIYKDKQINGVDLTTIINKAIDNNENILKKKKMIRLLIFVISCCLCL